MIATRKIITIWVRLGAVLACVFAMSCAGQKSTSKPTAKGVPEPEAAAEAGEPVSEDKSGAAATTAEPEAPASTDTPDEEGEATGEEGPKKIATTPQAEQALAEGINLINVDPAAAAAAFEQALNADPGLYLAAYNVGVAREVQGDLDAAKKAYERALEIKKDYGPALFNLAFLRVRQGQRSQALSALENHMELDGPRCVTIDVCNAVAALEMDKGNTERVMELSKKVLKADERNVEAMINLGKVYLKLGKKELARSILENAVEIEPHNASALNTLAFVYIDLNDRRTALDRFQRAAETSNGSFEPLVNAGRLLAEARDYDGAVKFLEAGVRVYPNCAPCWLDYGNALRGLIAKKATNEEKDQVVGQAEEAYNKAIQLKGDLNEIYFNLGILHLDRKYKKEEETSPILEKASTYFAKYLDAAKGEDDELTDRVEKFQKDIKRTQDRIKKRLERKKKMAEEQKEAEAEAAKKAAEEAAKQPPPEAAPPAGETPAPPAEPPPAEPGAAPPPAEPSGPPPPAESGPPEPAPGESTGGPPPPPEEPGVQ